MSSRCQFANFRCRIVPSACGCSQSAIRNRKSEMNLARNFSLKPYISPPTLHRSKTPLLHSQMVQIVALKSYFITIWDLELLWVFGHWVLGYFKTVWCPCGSTSLKACLPLLDHRSPAFLVSLVPWWLNFFGGVPVCPGLSRFVPHLKTFYFFQLPSQLCALCPSAEAILRRMDALCG